MVFKKKNKKFLKPMLVTTSKTLTGLAVNYTIKWLRVEILEPACLHSSLDWEQPGANYWIPSFLICEMKVMLSAHRAVF